MKPWRQIRLLRGALALPYEVGSGPAKGLAKSTGSVPIELSTEQGPQNIQNCLTSSGEGTLGPPSRFPAAGQCEWELNCGARGK